MKTLEAIRAFFRSIIPVKRQTVFDRRLQTMGLASRMDAERLHAIFEAADGGNPRDLFALYEEIVLTDSHLQGEFAKRKLAVLGDPLTVLPKDEKAAADVAAAEFVRGQFARCDGLLAAWQHLLDSVLWPVAIVEKVFRPTATGFDLCALVPVPDQLLDWTEGTLRIRRTNEQGLEIGGFHDVEAARYIVHRGHLLTFPDFRGGPLRSLVWWWLLTTMDREWWGRFLDRYGAPFLVGKYDQADDASRGVLERAFSYATRIGGLVVSKETEVEIQQALTGQAGDAFEKLWTIGCREKSKLILGQTGSAEAQAQGIGSGASQQHEAVRGDVREWDAARLADSVLRQLVEQLLRINGLPGSVRLAFGAEEPEDSAATGALLMQLKNAGYRVTDEGVAALSVRLGMPLERDPGGGGVLSLGARAISLSAASPSLVAADRANVAIAKTGAAELARAFSGAFAPVRRLVLESRSPEELQASLVALYSDWPAGRVAALIEEALVAFAANRSGLDE